MARGLDHVVHAVRDLDAAAALYRRLGFTVGARNRHPWGTHNHIVQLPSFFIELLTLAEPDKLGSEGLSILFGGYTREFLARGEGFSLLILESKDAAADERVITNAGIAQSDTMKFEREAKRPDGSAVKVEFSLTFAEDAGAPFTHFATCQQHFPKNFWNPAFQQHANNVQSVAGVVMTASRPAKHANFLSAFVGAPVVRSSSDAVVVKTPRGDIAVMDPLGYRSAFGVAAPPVTAGARLAALRLTTGDLRGTEDVLRNADVAFSGNGGHLVVGAATVMGATIVFEQAGKSAP